MSNTIYMNDSHRLDHPYKYLIVS